MTQVYRHRPRTPRQAAARRQPLDALLDPGLFKALADPTRVLLLGCLIKCGRPCSVGEIAECCSVDLSVVSRHLKQLEAAGVTTTTKEGRTVLYTVRYDHVCRTLRALCDAIERCCPSDSPGACCAESGCACRVDRPAPRRTGTPTTRKGVRP